MTKRKTAVPSRMLSVKDIVKCCLVSERSIRRWIKAGELTVHRLGRRVLISEEDLVHFLETRRG